LKGEVPLIREIKIPPLASPKQFSFTTESTTTVSSGKLLRVMLSVKTHELLSVTVSVYTPPGKLSIADIVSEFYHRKENGFVPPIILAEIVPLAFPHVSSRKEKEISIESGCVINCDNVWVQLLESVTITV